MQRLAAAGWLAYAGGAAEEGLRLMRASAELEDGSEKSGVSPGRLIAARELLGDMLLQESRAAEALAEYERSLIRDPNRRTSFRGARDAAERAGQADKARYFATRLTELSVAADPPRR
jgi:hypothetical protein